MSRRNRGIFWAPRASSFNNSSDSDEFPLAFLRARRQPRKKKTPTKRATPRRNTRQARRRAQDPVAIINLDSPSVETMDGVDSPVVADPHSVVPPVVNDLVVKSKVGSKVSDFFKSGRFLSSDEEDPVEEPTRPSEAPASPEICLSDDSVVEIPNSLALPSTSTASEVQQAAEDNPEITKDKHNEHDSFMDYVDSVLNGDDCESNKPSNDMKSFDDWSKETEEMLKGTSSLLDQLRGTTQQQEEQQKKTEEAAKPPTAPTEPETPPVSSCPICYEPYSNVAAAATICGHIFCKQCITMACKANKKCPTCRKALTLKKIHPIYFN